MPPRSVRWRPSIVWNYWNDPDVMTELQPKYETLIIGAGPAGMAAAMELTWANKEFAVVEKASSVGGLAKTYTIKEGDDVFRTDNGPHRFFSKNAYLYDFIGDVLKERWIVVRRQTRQFIDGTFFDYPVKIAQVIKNVGPWRVLVIMSGYAAARFRHRFFWKPMTNFYDYAVANFGLPLARFNILNYTEKIWGVSTKELHADWATQRISGLNVTTLVLNAVKKMLRIGGSVKAKSLVDSFYYPEEGTGTIYETIRGRIEEKGHPVFVNTHPTKIFHDGRRLTKATLSTSQGDRDVAFDRLVESIPITDFLTLLDPLPPADVLAAAHGLRFRSQVHLFITLNKDRITDDQWIYFPDEKIPFARVSEMKNFSEKMCPPGKTSWFIEFFCNEGDAVSRMTADELFEAAMPHIEKAGFFTRKDVRRYYRFPGGKDYPIYDLTYERNLNVLKTYLDGFENLYYIGRPGRFKYTNQDHSLEMGIMAAKSIIDGKRRDLEAVGSEKAYFEAGALPSKS